MTNLEKRDEIRSKLSGRMLELFDKTWSAVAITDPDPDLVLMASEQVFATEQAEARTMEAIKTVRDIIRRRSRACNEFMLRHQDIGTDDVTKVSDVFFSAKDPEALIDLSLEEILEIYRQVMNEE